MNLPDALKKCFSEYVTFSGRASRSEYWYWILFLFIVGFILGIIGGAIKPLVILIPIFQVITLLPGISVLVRRLHDTNHSGWWFWLNLVPLVGMIIVLVWLCSKGTTGDNRFGPDPLV